MTDCHKKLQPNFLPIFWVFILLFGPILAADAVNIYFSDNVKSKQAAVKDEMLNPESSNPSGDEELSLELQSAEKQRRKGEKLNSGKESTDLKNDAEFNNDAEEESDDIGPKGRVSHSISDRNKRRHNKARSGPKIWDHWGKWTTCSVSCGIGKTTRWRHCVSGGCSTGEKEAQIKTCSLPAC